MKTMIWERNGGYVVAAKFANGNYAVGTKVMKTRKGAESYAKRLDEFCGPAYGRDVNGERTVGNNFPWTTANDKGEITRHFVHQAGVSV